MQLKGRRAEDTHIQEDIKILRQLRDNLDQEYKFFLSLGEDECQYEAPLFYLNAMDETSADYQSLNNLKLAVLKLHATNAHHEPLSSVSQELWFLLYKALRHIRREQRSYLLAEGRQGKNTAGLWMFDKAEVLGRIKNYALLFSPDLDVYAHSQGDLDGSNYWYKQQD